MSTTVTKYDKVTQDRILRLHPAVADEVTELINVANAKLPANVQIRIVQGLRTIAEQDALYDQGRTKPGKIVTKAKGGSSIHNYGLAIDFVLLIDGKEISWDTKADRVKDGVSDWLEVVLVFTKAGWTWGGNWRTFKDLPHLEKTFGNTWRTLKAKHDNKQFLPGSKYVVV